MENTQSTIEGLQQLEKKLLKDLEMLDYPKKPWVLSPEDRETKTKKKINGHVYDVLIIGGGQSGLAIAFGLLREKVSNILVVDENPEGLEGPWKNFARMITLRTPKYLTGPDWGIPNLTFQAWYEAQYGEKKWEEVELIPKEIWADYIIWYRQFLKIPVQNESRAGAVQWKPDEECFAVPVTKDSTTSIFHARKIVLATGIEGSGQWKVPDFISKNLNKKFYAHTREDIDFESLKGKRIGILGAGASAFDNGSVALETGASEVHLFFRREKLVDINPYRWAEFTGFLKHHSDLPDSQRWNFILQILRMGQLPPSDTFQRAKKFSGFHLHPGSPWLKVSEKGGKSLVETPKGSFEYDFLIIGTGFVTDLASRPELAEFHSKIALWGDKYNPPEKDRQEDLARHPYLGANFQFQEKVPGTAPFLNSVYNYTFGGLLSLGFAGATISGMKYSLPKVISGITKQLFIEDSDYYYRSLQNYDVKEF